MTRRPDGRPSVVWTRGKGCAELASALSSDASRISGELAEACLEHRADILVSRRLPGNFDLANVVVPVGFEADRVTNVVATVGGGPHSRLAAETAVALGNALGVPAEMVSAIGPGQEDTQASDVLEQVGSGLGAHLGRRVVDVGGPSELVDVLDEGALVIIGAPGGSWLQRAMLGPGARLRRTAEAGVVIVRSAPDRVFRFMGEPVYVAPLRQADDTLRLHREETLAVADEGMLVGLVRRELLERAGASPVGSVMEDAVSVRLDETLAEASQLGTRFGPDPIPVTDHEEYLVGGLTLPVG